MKRFLKKNLSLLLSLLALFTIVGSTYAYLVATDSEILNSFKLAKVDTKIDEQTGEAGLKIVKIQNENISPVYVRARVLVSGGDVGVADANIQFVASEATPPVNGINVVYNSTDWVMGGDGWFYYRHVLPGTSDTNPTPMTQELISKVLVGSGVQPPQGSSGQFEVDVYQESVLTSATGDVADWHTVQAAFVSNAQA